MKDDFRDAQESTMEVDEYCFLFAIRDLGMEMSDKLIKIHGRRPERVDRLVDMIKEEVAGLLELM